MIVACGGPAGPVETSTPPSPITTLSGSASPGPVTDPPPATGDVAGFAVETVLLGGRPLLVAVADTPDLRARGLMEVRDLGDLDGMLFVFDAEVSVDFVMRNTVIPLDIAFFDEDGVEVGRVEMVPCREEPCPLYGAGAGFRYALEMPAGTIGESSAPLDLTLAG